MIKEKQILELAKINNGIVTTKDVTKNNIPRIYLTKLIKDKKLFRIDRGIYSTNKINVDPLYSMQTKSKKIIFSHFTSLNIQGFHKNIDSEEQISVPQSYNAKKFINLKVFYNNKKTFNEGLIEYEYKGQKLKIYDIERSVCDIIKDRHRFNEDKYNKFINYYFNLEHLNYNKLFKYSSSLKVSKLVHHYLSLFKA